MSSDLKESVSNKEKLEISKNGILEIPIKENIKEEVNFITFMYNIHVDY